MHEDILFRGKPIDELTREEAIEALKQALSEVRSLREVAATRPVYKPGAAIEDRPFADAAVTLLF